MILVVGGGLAWHLHSEKKKFPRKKKAKAVRLVPKGEELLKSRTGTSTHRNGSTVNYLNGNIYNLVVSRKKSSGQLVIRFDYAGLGEKKKIAWVMVNGHPQPMRMLVRLFDENGQYLKHFTTKEEFVSERFRVHDPSKGILPVHDKKNKLVYTVNARDLNFVQIVEVGWTWP